MPHIIVRAAKRVIGDPDSYYESASKLRKFIAEEESAINSPAAAYDDWYVIGDSEQAYALIGTGLTAKEIDKYPFSTCILIGDESQRRAARTDSCHEFSRTFFIDYSLPSLFPDAI